VPVVLLATCQRLVAHPFGQVASCPLAPYDFVAMAEFSAFHLAAHFNVLINDRRVSLQAVSALHDIIPGEADPDIRQTVTLRRAVTTDKMLYWWYRDTRLGKDTAQTVTLIQLDSPDGKPVNAWKLHAAIPVRWTGPSFHALRNELAFESLELRYESISWMDSP